LFWCSEHVFEAVVGVDEAISGYAGGTTKSFYEQVGSNNTGHAEAIAVYYDPKVISFKELVNVFFASQDPTTPINKGIVVLPIALLPFIKMQQRRKLLKIKLELTAKCLPTLLLPK
jgi:peptide-methionine (S)-S-oxide reductase